MQNTPLLNPLQQRPHRQLLPDRIDEVGKMGLYLGSSLSTGVTGQIMYVDAGASILAEPGAVDRPQPGAASAPENK